MADQQGPRNTPRISAPATEHRRWGDSTRFDQPVRLRRIALRVSRESREKYGHPVAHFTTEDGEYVPLCTTAVGRRPRWRDAGDPGYQVRADCRSCLAVVRERQWDLPVDPPPRTVNLDRPRAAPVERSHRPRVRTVGVLATPAEREAMTNEPPRPPRPRQVRQTPERLPYQHDGPTRSERRTTAGTTERPIDVPSPQSLKKRKRAARRRGGRK